MDARRHRRRVRTDAAGWYRHALPPGSLPQERLKLCPYRDQLPATADQFLWGNSMFNTLGRFKGLNDEMGSIVVHSLSEYPAWQAEAALAATAQQLVHVATGEGTNGWIPHTYGIIERYIPAQLKPMRAARQQHWQLDFTAINRIHVPVALASMLMVLIIFGSGLWLDGSTTLPCLPARSRWRCGNACLGTIRPATATAHAWRG